MNKNDKNIIGMIPARGGSKEVKNKNIRYLHGKPLIAYTIECGLACPSINKLVVSTDSLEIAEISRQWGAEVPFIRPSELAEDDTPMLPVIQHSIKSIEDIYNRRVDFLILLQPTSPLRNSSDIENALELFTQDGLCQAVISGGKAKYNPCFSMASLDNGYVRLILASGEKIFGRQNCPPVYNLNGTVWIYSREAIMDLQQRIPPQTKLFIVPDERIVEIDTENDFKIAEILISQIDL